MAFPIQSILFEEIRSGWPGRPYPLLVDYLDVPDGRVCPAASLYALGKVHGDHLKTVDTKPGEVVACFPGTWIDWVGMLQGCLRRGAVFAPLTPGSEVERERWAEAVDAGLVLDNEGALRTAKRRKVQPCGLIVGPPAIGLSELELLRATEPETVDPRFQPRQTIGLDDRLAPVAHAMALITLLRAQAEAHVGVGALGAVEAARSQARFLDRGGFSRTLSNLSKGSGGRVGRS